MSSEQKIALSTSKYFRNKSPLGDKRAYAEGFENRYLTIPELANVIFDGMAFSYQFKDGKRNGKNFIATDFLAADFDGNITIDEALQLEPVKKYGSLFYTTSSHRPDQPRFRVVFALDRTLKDRNEVKFATRALAQRLGSDMSATDAARMFFGAKNCNYQILGSTVSNEFLDDLINDGRLDVTNIRTSGNTPVASRTYQRIKPDEVIRLKSGVECKFKEIKAKQSVFCPFHPDKRASAFVSESDGDFFLHCSACGKTWWSAKSRVPEYDFYAFENALRKINEHGIREDSDMSHGLEDFLDGDDGPPTNIYFLNDRYLNLGNYNKKPKKQRVTLIKSPKGSGKTTYLASALRTARSNDKKILLIGHRQALIGELCDRLGLNCYLDYPEYGRSGGSELAKQRYGVCLDSLRRVQGQQYDIVVIDEVEQVLGHFLSDTIGASRSRIFEEFFRIIRQAKQVIALDADLDWPTFSTIKKIKSLSIKDSENLTLENKSCPIDIFVNEHVTEGRELKLFLNDNHLVQQLCSLILEGKRVFVTSNSKSRVDALEKIIDALARDADLVIPYISITSTNSKSKDAQGFIKDVTREILNYQVVMSSPSLGTGIDITFPNDAQEIDVVVGLFEAGVTNHLEIDQQLARVRNPKETYVWVSPQRANFETAFEVVVDDVLQGDLVGTIRYGLGWKDRKTLADEDPFLTMAAALTAKNRGSQNNLRSNFLKHKTKQGWTIVTVDRDDALADEGKRLSRLGAAVSAAEDMDRLLNAEILDIVEYMQLKRVLEFENGTLTEEQRCSLRRTALELFYRKQASPDLIALDDKANYRQCVRRFEALRDTLAEPEHFKVLASADQSREVKRSRISVVPERRMAAGLLHSLLSTTPAYHGGKFDTKVEYDQNDLQEFASLSLKYKSFMEGQFNILTRRDVEKKPMQHLGKVLRLIGLRHEQVRSSVQNGERIRHYRITEDSLNTLEQVLRRRTESGPWHFLNTAYGFNYTIEQIEEILDSPGYF